MSYIVRELKPTFEKLTEPFLVFLERIGATPNMITFMGLVFVLFGSLALYSGYLLLSFVLLLLGALSDALDGSLARRLGKNSDLGAFLDSLLDRLSDALPFIAIALSSEDKLLSLFALMAMLFSFTVSYSRARAEGLGYELKVGTFERPERWFILLAGIALDLVFPAVVLIAVGSLITTLQRVYIFRKLTRR
ncbi:CDP-alcohol phosphatidyltransferase family protein [Pampinifervens florentissimum]|uniref:CDP-alcohol phosphatidyltransferase family protein n=1 Tax=Pampinifervens florentissimum TaxID=1632019 RepID=UPI0013B48C00|nr:CDP-alcohol phosphatidyltransferase family protein [Hydrogenobacter sp. T-8]QID32460.1 CDP-alcohol phosphatidyltransferase family protein [Hydrogenobacter sp. T-8]